ncbi:MAG TPA: UbiD family decarboxylase [Chloroflexi bacterium]|nr:UbiD family decarboxylase [Chloroflexota bacterium]
MDMRTFLAWAETSGDLVEIERGVAPHLELAQIMHALDGRPVLFRTLTGFSDWQAVAGICAQRRYFAAALNCVESDLIHRIADGLAHPLPPPLLDAGSCQEVVQAQVDLTRLPIPRYHPDDGGPYVTSGVAVIKDPDWGRNISFHRLMRLDERRLVARIVEGRGTHTALAKTAQPLPVAIAIGCPIHVLLAAATSPPPGVDELGIAHALAATPLVTCQTVELEVPADAELILEGHITHTLTDEGPFPDLTETMDGVRRQPVIEIARVTHRQSPIFHALLPGGMEHKSLMGMPREPTIFAAVEQVCRCTGVYITPGGASWLHAVVQIEKQHDEDGRRAVWAAFQGHTSLKHVVVVDTDVNIYDPADVEWAIATRFQADRNLIVLKDEPGSSLDPSAMHALGQKTRTAKMGLDATAPLDVSRRDYERVKYAPMDPGRYGLKIVGQDVYIACNMDDSSVL